MKIHSSFRNQHSSLFIDSWGRGFEKIAEACRSANLPEPKVIERSGGIAIELFKAESKTTPVKTDTSEQSVNDFGKISERLRKELGNRLGNRLGNTKMAILNEMIKNPKVSGDKLAEIIGISSTAIENNIKQLKELELISREGGTRGSWVITAKPNDEG